MPCPTMTMPRTFTCFAGLARHSAAFTCRPGRGRWRRLGGGRGRRGAAGGAAVAAQAVCARAAPSAY
eukprot:scaffold81048_cov49-Phaeocystis_antarctica.AAC.2